MNILANDGISPSGAKALQDAGHTLYTEFVAAEHLEAFLHEKAIDGVLVRSATKIRRPLIDACPRLKFIGRGGVGMDNIDVEYARGKGLTVFNTPAASSQSVAELVMGHLFSVARFLADSNRSMPTKGHDGFKTLKKAFGKGTELRGKTLGIVGFGRIGRSLASYALGCGMKVVTTASGLQYEDVLIGPANTGEEPGQGKIVGFNVKVIIGDSVSFRMGSVK